MHCLVPSFTLHPSSSLFFFSSQRPRNARHRRLSTLATSACAPDVRSPAPGASPPLGVVVTGGTQGLGFHLAREFLLQNPSSTLLIASRDASRTQRAGAYLASEFGASRVHWQAADVADPADVAALAEAAAKKKS